MSGITNIFGSSGSSKAADQITTNANTAQLSPQEVKKQLQDQVAQELAIANATELVNKVTANCFDLCFPQPGPSISNGERECTKKCMEKYMHAWNLLSRTYVARIQQASASGQI